MSFDEKQYTPLLEEIKAKDTDKSVDKAGNTTISVEDFRERTDKGKQEILKLSEELKEISERIDESLGKLEEYLNNNQTDTADAKKASNIKLQLSLYKGQIDETIDGIGKLIAKYDDKNGGGDGKGNTDKTGDDGKEKGDHTGKGNNSDKIDTKTDKNGRSEPNNRPPTRDIKIPELKTDISGAQMHAGAVRENNNGFSSTAGLDVGKETAKGNKRVAAAEGYTHSSKGENGNTVFEHGGGVAIGVDTSQSLSNQQRRLNIQSKIEAMKDQSKVDVITKLEGDKLTIQLGILDICTKNNLTETVYDKIIQGKSGEYIKDIAKIKSDDRNELVKLIASYKATQSSLVEKSTGPGK